MEAENTLQLAHNIASTDFALIGDFNAHLGSERVGCITEHLLLSGRNDTHR